MTEKGGYDVKFVGVEPLNVTCSICLFTLREPMQAEECGHRFCKSCVEELPNGDNGKPLCPEDRSEMILFQDKGKQRDILDCLVLCTNSEDGCLWTKELRYFEDHTKDECPFTLLECTNHGCTDQIQRQNLFQHCNEFCLYRMSTCAFCSLEFAFNLSQEHNLTCEEYPSNCEFCSQEDVLRSKMKVHISEECTMVPQDCQFALLGCEEKILSGGLLKHNQEAVGLHLDLALKRITLQDEKLQSQEKTITVQEGRLKFQETEIKTQAIQISKIMEKLNEIEKKPEVNSPFTDHFIWKINQFSDEKQKAKNDPGYELTKCFYTSRGHKLEIELFPNGNGPRRNKNMAICARTVQGSFDDTINWPMKAIIEFYALDRSGNRRSYISFNTNQTADVTESFVKPPHTENGRGIDHFVSLSNGNPYPNDTFTVEVMIKYKDN
uniref:Uncharacterized protein n=1 Tax=Clytia hemisphaerica TaxID=252671 RepID=A0A7M5X679_9CNID